MNRTEHTDAAGKVVSVTYSDPNQHAQPLTVPAQPIDPDPGGLIAQAERQKQFLIEEAEREKKREEARVNRNVYLDAHPPRPNFQDTPGQKAYKFVRNLKGTDGNWYALYESVSGSKTRVYSMSERKWYTDRGVTYFNCNKCGDRVENAITGIVNTCPKCGNSQRLYY